MSSASRILEANLDRVFNERDAARRLAAIQELYAPDAKLYDSEGVSTGLEAIAAAVTKLMAALPPTLTFVPLAPAMLNHQLGKLLWRGLFADGTVLMTGTDVAQLSDGRIRTIHVFVDAPA